MSRHNVGKQTDHQGERFCEHAEELHKRHDRQRHLQVYRHLRPKYVFPVFLCREQIDNDKRTACQDCRYGNVTCDVSAARKDRYDADQVIDQNKEKDRQQIR